MMMVVRIDVDARLSMLAIRLIRALCHALMKELPLLTLRLTHLPSVHGLLPRLVLCLFLLSTRAMK